MVSEPAAVMMIAVVIAGQSDGKFAAADAAPSAAIPPWSFFARLPDDDRLPAWSSKALAYIPKYTYAATGFGKDRGRQPGRSGQLRARVIAQGPPRLHRLGGSVRSAASAMRRSFVDTASMVR